MFSQFLELLAAAEFGFTVGDALNDLFVQDLIDTIGDEPGSGAAGEAYLGAINTFGDPFDWFDGD